MPLQLAEPEAVDPLYDNIDNEILATADAMGQEGEWECIFQFQDQQGTVTQDSRRSIDGLPVKAVPVGSTRIAFAQPDKNRNSIRW